MSRSGNYLGMSQVCPKHAENVGFTGIAVSVPDTDGVPDVEASFELPQPTKPTSMVDAIKMANVALNLFISFPPITKIAQRTFSRSLALEYILTYLTRKSSIYIVLL